MKNYKIAFVGLGSIATRHLKNVHVYLASRGDSCMVDLYRSSLGRPMAEELQPFVANSFLYANEIPAERVYDVVFVTNPTSMHYETITRFANHTDAFFIEKPVFDSTKVDEHIFKMIEDKESYVACPLRYNPVLQYVKDNVDLKNVYCARAISSSYLPDWRPEQDYRNTYSAHKDMGGGVSIDLIHEWDYLTWLFGRHPQRTLDLFTAEDTIHCDLIAGTVSYLNKGETIKFESERNAFQMKEIEHFFEIINHKIENDSTPEHAYRVLKIAKGEF